MEVVPKEQLDQLLVIGHQHSIHMNLLIYYHQMLIDLLTQTLKHLNTFLLYLIEEARMREKMDQVIGNYT